MDHAQLHDAFERIDFSLEQKRALEKILEKTEASHELALMAEKDHELLRDVNGPCSLSHEREAYIPYLGELAGMYPVLILLSRVEWLCGEYKKLGIPETVLNDTLSDIPLWINNSIAHTGRMELNHYDWLSGFLRLKTFRLGRLEFIYTKSRAPEWFYRNRENGSVMALASPELRVTQEGELTGDSSGIQTMLIQNEEQLIGNAVMDMGRINPVPETFAANEWKLMLAPNDPVLDVHIPEGPPMHPSEIADSLNRAPAFFRTYFGVTDARAFTCGSWLMTPALRKLLPESNLARFQERFYIAPYTTRENQVFDRVYGKPLSCWEDMPMNTRLQRGVRDWYLCGGHCRQMMGVILMDELKSENEEEIK